MKEVIYLVLFLTSQIVFSQDQMYEICPLKVGSEIPNTSVADAENKAITLTSLVTDQPTVLIFYRGAWCGYCTKHLSELNEAKEEIEKLGYQIIGITVDHPEKLEESNKKSESEITVYSDLDVETIKAFGLDWNVGDELFTKYKNDYKLDLEEWSGADHHSLPVPAIFIIKDNKVEFQYVNPNYRKRLKSATLLGILKTL